MCLPWRFCPSHTHKHAGQCVSIVTISQLGVQEGMRARALTVATSLSVFPSYTPTYAHDAEGLVNPKVHAKFFGY
jgi:hypothetical protein